MGTELFSIWGFQTGWRSQYFGADRRGYQVTANLDGVSIYHVGPTTKVVERSFSRACRRTFLRRYIKWLARPVEELELWHESPGQVSDPNNFLS